MDEEGRSRENEYPERRKKLRGTLGGDDEFLEENPWKRILQPHKADSRGLGFVHNQ